jgi:hypothetical protein
MDSHFTKIDIMIKDKGGNRAMAGEESLAARP